MKGEHISEIDIWRKYAKALNFPLPAEAEKDYLQDILLRSIYSVIGSELIFRGGTAISKIYASGRFSEDLDFIINHEFQPETGTLIKKLEDGIKNMDNYFQHSFSKKSYRDMVSYTIKIDGPLYVSTSNDSAKQKILIDLNTYEKNLLKPNVPLRQTPYPNLPPYTLTVERETELLADKIKAAIERKHKHKAAFVRDIYDIWALTTKYGMNPDFSMVRKKMDLYGTVEFSMAEFKSCIDEVGEHWKEELETVISAAPEYPEVKKSLKRLIA